MITVLMMLAHGQEPVPAEQPAPLRLHLFRQAVPGFSEAADLAGHTGDVVVEADVRTNGTLGPAMVVTSSRSDLLDAAALARMADYRLMPTREPYRAQMTFTFDSADVSQMTCEAFGRQVRWHETTWPERNVRETKIFQASAVQVVVAAMTSGRGSDVALTMDRKLEQAWPRIIEDCERRPARPLVEVLGARVR